MSEPESVFARAKLRKGIGDLLGVPAHAVHHKRLKVCPLCGRRFTFSYTDEHFQCWSAACGERGDVIDLAAAVWGVSKLTAARDLAGEPGSVVRTFKPRPPRAPDADIAEAQRRRDTIGEILAQAAPATGTIVQAYLAARGVSAPVIAKACERLLFNERAIWREAIKRDDGTWAPSRRAPAMVAIVSARGVDTGGIHCTYLARDGSGKAKLDPAKKMWGEQRNANGQPGGMLLIPPAPGGPLCVGEGIENTLVLASYVEGAGAFAAGSLDRLQGGLAENEWGRTDWRAPRADEAKPAAVFKHSGPVWIALDADMSPLVLERGTKWERTISGARRAQISGVLAAHWWKRAGASSVSAVMPPDGLDASDWRKAIAGGV